MIARLSVTVAGWYDDHEDDEFAVLDPVYAMLDAAKAEGVVSDYNWSEGPGGHPGHDVEDPIYVFIVVTDNIADVRRRAYALAASTGPDTIIDCDVE